MDSHAVVVGRLPGVARPAALAEPEVEPSGGGRRKAMRVPRLIGKIGLNIVFLAMMGCVAIMLGPALLGYQRYVILTGSMTGTYDRGSIVYDKPVPTASLKVGDPITYSPPPGFTHQARVSHRIYSIHRGPNGERVFKTKGDANKHPDIWTFTLNRPTQQEVKFHIPEVGYLFLLLSIREFRLAIVGVPVVIIGLIMLVRLWREAGAEARRQKLAELGWRAVADAGSGAVLAPVDVPATQQVSPVVDLHLRVPPGQVPRSPAGQDSARPRIDLRKPLRIRPLTTVRVIAEPTDAWGSPGAPAAGASLATLRLLVSRMAAGSSEPDQPDGWKPGASGDPRSMGSELGAPAA